MLIIKKHSLDLFLLLSIFCLHLKAEAQAVDNPPNIIFIMADDLGYGDISCLNDSSKIKTPNVDSLAKEGIAFTDAHSSSAVCTPTRYSVLTGRYNWRSRMKSGVLNGYSSALIEKDRVTVASMLKKKGYHTACVGKWHLGMNWAKQTDAPKKVDYTKPITSGPNSVGFDYYFGISASLDMPPYVFIENDRSVGVPTTTKAFHRKGEAHVDFEAVDVLPWITEKAVEYINQRGKEKKPFFLYFPLNSPHTPIVPTDEFKGKSGLGSYGDFVMQTDWSVGEIMKALEKNKLVENTLIIFTSDNGCSPQAKFKDLAAKGHNPSYQFRGHKADIFEGGHRVPFVARWPAKVKQGVISNQTICLVDLLATAADINGVDVEDNFGEDSVSFLPALLNPKIKKPLREATVHHSINGSFAIRQGKWKLSLCPGSGGWSDPSPRGNATVGLPPVQLYDLSKDIGEQKNLQAENPEVVKQLTELLQKYVDQGRSTPGDTQGNNGAINIHKKPKKPAKAKKKKAGVDKTGSFDIVENAEVIKHDMGYEISSSGYGVALKKIKTSSAGTLKFNLKYKSTSQGGTKNAVFVFGEKPEINSLMNCGTLYVAGSHDAWQGEWGKRSKGKTVKKPIDSKKEFTVVVTVNLKKRSVVFQIDGEKIETALPKDIKQINYIGYLVSNTKSAFSEIEIE